VTVLVTATRLPLEAHLKTSEKHLVLFVVLLALTWVFLHLDMEVFAR